MLSIFTITCNCWHISVAHMVETAFEVDMLRTRDRARLYPPLSEVFRVLCTPWCMHLFLSACFFLVRFEMTNKKCAFVRFVSSPALFGLAESAYMRDTVIGKSCFASRDHCVVVQERACCLHCRCRLVITCFVFDRHVGIRTNHVVCREDAYNSKIVLLMFSSSVCTS